MSSAYWDPSDANTNERLEQVLAKLDGVKRSGDRAMARCPSHDDDEPSLSIGLGKDGRILVHCHAGCTLASIMAAIGLNVADLFVSSNGHAHHARPRVEKKPKRYPSMQALAEAAARFTGGKLEGTYPYHDENGKPVFGVVRVRLPNGGKEVPQFRPDAGGWVFGAPKGPRPLFRLPELLAASLDTPVQFFEGEQKAELAASLGFIATSCSQGAGKARFHDFGSLHDRLVYMFPDENQVGREHADDVVRRAYAAGATSVAIVNLPGLPDGGDIVDFVKRRRADERVYEHE